MQAFVPAALSCKALAAIRAAQSGANPNIDQCFGDTHLIQSVANMRIKRLKAVIFQTYSLCHGTDLIDHRRRVMAQGCGQDNRVVQPMPGIVFGANHMGNGVHQTQTLEKGNSRQARTSQHRATGLKV